MSTILFLTPRFPWPLTKGDQLRAYNQVKYLSKFHRIILFSITEKTISEEWLNELKPFCIDIEIFHLSRKDIMLAGFRRMTSKLPFQSIYHYNARAAKWISALYKEHQPDQVIIQLIRMVPYATLFPQEKCIIDLMDCFSYHYLLRGRHSGAKDRWFYDFEYRRVKNYELEILSRFKKVTVISKKDRELLPGNTENVVIVPNGVDGPGEDLSFDKSIDLLFLGNLSYEPNVAAAEYVVRKILPELNKLIPKIKVVLAGKDPGQKILSLVSEQVKLEANVPDVYPLFCAAKIFIAPMFLSTGVQNKILEAMAAGVIVITSPNAADAIGAVPGVQLLTAISPAEFASHIEAILKRPCDFLKIPPAAMRLLAENFTWKKNTEVLHNLVAGK